MRGIPFIMSAPAGTGKTTLIKALAKQMPHVIQSISYTSRSPREGEVDGVDYHFVTRETFQQMIDSEDFLEHVELYGDLYGTSKSWVEKQLNQGKHVFLVIDTQGAKTLKGQYPAVFIFVFPPSEEELKRRLEGRKSEDSDSIQKRLKWAKNELKSSDFYDYHIVNKEVDEAVSTLKSIIIAEEHRNR